MILEKVIADSGVTAVEGSVDIDITSVCNDSRKAAQGSLFVAVKGFASDGHNFIATAVKNGACVVVCEDIDMAHRQIAEAGAEDIKSDEGEYTIYTDPADLDTVRDAIIAAGYQISTADLAKVPSTYVDLTSEEDIANMEKMLDKFNEDDDVNAVYHNWDM